MKKKKQDETVPEDPRQKVRIFRNGLNAIAEFYICPNSKVINLDLYYDPPELDLAIRMSVPSERAKND